MSIPVSIIIILICVAGLWFGAVWIVESASRIAKKVGLSEFVIGLTVVAIATSAPEFAVSISAALADKLSISVGNVVGSNIFNLGVILGLVALFGVIKTNRLLLFRDGSLLVGTGFLLLFFFRDLELSLIEGILLSTTLIIYIFILFRQKEKSTDDIPAGDFKWFDIPKLVVGVTLIIFSADFLVDSAVDLAKLLGISEWMIGITIVAAGTSIPELATSLVALSKGRHGISIGNLIGSDLFNMLGVLGLASIIKPLTIDGDDYISIILLTLTLVIIFFMIRTSWRLSKMEGILLILIALCRWWVVAYL
ncbi:calcium/sodium antiporter [Bacteroidota bacterium]